MDEDLEQRRSELLKAIDQAEASLARGEGRTVTTHEEVRMVVEDVRRRGMARLARERDSSR